MRGRWGRALAPSWKCWAEVGRGSHLDGVGCLGSGDEVTRGSGATEKPKMMLTELS